MPPGETMFKFHGYSGPCPKEPLPKPAPINWQERAERAEAEVAVLERVAQMVSDYYIGSLDHQPGYVKAARAALEGKL
jgi:hypothetical protein